MEILDGNDNVWEIGDNNREYIMLIRVSVIGGKRTGTNASLAYSSAQVERLLSQHKLTLYSSTSGLKIEADGLIDFQTIHEMNNPKVANEQFEYLKYFDINVNVIKRTWSVMAEEYL